MFIQFKQSGFYMRNFYFKIMPLRVISTKLTEEEHGRVTEICNKSECSLSALLKQTITDFVDREIKKLDRPVQATGTSNFSMKPQNLQEKKKIATNIRYQYF